MPSATQPGVFYMSTNNTTREEGVKVLYCAKSTNKFRTQRCISGNLGQTLHPLYFTASCWGWIQELVGKHKAWKYKQNGLFGTWYPLLGANFYWLYWHTHIHHTTFCKYYYYGSQLQGQFYIQMASSSRSTPIWKRGEGPPSGGERALFYNSQGMGLFFLLCLLEIRRNFRAGQRVLKNHPNIQSMKNENETVQGSLGTLWVTQDVKNTDAF